MVKKHVAFTVDEFIRVSVQIAEQEKSSVWFRGHSCASYRLIPSALRSTVQKHDARGNPLRGDETLRSSGIMHTGINPERMLDEFKRRAVPFTPNLPRNDFEWMFLMQHFGVPTRLLDWTTNALVALYFACEHPPTAVPAIHDDDERDLVSAGGEFSTDAMAVYCIPPAAMNRVLHDIKGPIDITANFESWKAYAAPTSFSARDTYAPICILAPHISPRIRAQSGTFTLHGSNLWELDFYNDLRPFIHKILIPKSRARSIQQQLRLLGMTTSFIYPDLEGIAREIRMEEQRRFDLEREEFLRENFPPNVVRGRRKKMAKK